MAQGIGRSLRSLVLTMVLAGAGVAGVSVALPALSGIEGVRSTIEGTWRSLMGNWTASACAADPVGCIAHQQTRLTGVLSRQEEAIRALRTAGETVAAAMAREEQRFGQNDLLLREGRTLVNAALGDGPVRFVGETYPDRAALTRQLQVLFAERQNLERVLTSMRSQAQAIRERHDELLVLRGEVRAALATLPAQIELARAGRVLAGISGAMQALTATATAAERRVGSLDALMRTTDELLRDRGPAVKPETTANEDDAFKRFMSPNRRG